MYKPCRPGTTDLTRRRRLLLLVAAVAGVGITATACGSGAASTGTYGGPANPAPSAKTVAAISTHSTKLGNVLAGPDGRSVYLFEKDHGMASSCSGACASVWPAVTSASAVAVSGMAQRALLGTTQRSDGATQVTYAGHPLYYFAGDHAPGDVAGQGLNDFGAGWYVVAANGHKIDDD
jgi:predicted lipoprotein with Yx(FWY)xxD motif